ncbi:MAG: cobalamin-dependent protein [Candidatus Woesearchaeota archaeon]
MRILFFNPPFTIYGGLEGHGGSAAPLNLAYLMSYLREKRNDELLFLDAEAERFTYRDIEAYLKEKRPDVIAITVPTPTFNIVLKCCRIAKKLNPNVKTVLGGPHPTVLPRITIRERDVDFVVVGEGEITFYELINSLSNGSDLSLVDGLVFKRGGIIFNRERELISNLDSLPFPARDLLPLHLYYPPPTKRVSGEKNSANIIGSRGCPYNCTYCIAAKIWRRKYRPRSPKNIVDEIEECVKKYGLKEFNFHDELFTLIEKRVFDICDEILKRKLDISWVCMARVDRLTKEMLVKMKKAGCKKIMFGFESGSEKVLKSMRKQANLVQARRAVKMVKEVGIDIAANFMFGHIGESKETIRETIEFAKEINADTTAFLIASPYPGTDFYRIARKKGYLRRNYNWEDFILVGDMLPLVNLPDLKPDEILKWQKRANREYYLRFGYIAMKLKKIRDLKDVKNLINGIRLFLKVS